MYELSIYLGGIQRFAMAVLGVPEYPPIECLGMFIVFVYLGVY